MSDIDAAPIVLTDPPPNRMEVAFADLQLGELLHHGVANFFALAVAIVKAVVSQVVPDPGAVWFCVDVTH